MADNIELGDQSVENATNAEPETPAIENISSSKTTLITPKQESENMEVHAHELHKAPGHGWKHYIFEFVMLFFAVFCGFLAENLREESVEHHRAKVYAANLYEELQKDIVSINSAIEADRLVIGKLDTFCLYSTEKSKLNITNGMLYYYGSYTTLLWVYSADNTTIDELKSSGNLRIMGNDISVKINAYCKLLSELENEYTLTRTEFATLEELYFKIFDGYTSQLLTRGTKPLLRDSIFKLNIPLISDDPKLMKEFTGWQKFEVSIYLRQIDTYLVPIRQIAIELLKLLQKEYHFE